MLDEVSISHWEPRHHGSLTSMMMRLLAVQEARGSFVAPTLRNATSMVDAGMAMAEAGDPCLVAEFEGRAIAMIMWGDANKGVLDYTKRVCNTLGSYTEPEYRHKGVSELLRWNGYLECKRLGYEVLDGQVWTDNLRGLNHFKSFHNAKVAAQYLYLEVT